MMVYIWCKVWLWAALSYFGLQKLRVSEIWRCTRDFGRCREFNNLIIVIFNVWRYGVTMTTTTTVMMAIKPRDTLVLWFVVYTIYTRGTVVYIQRLNLSSEQTSSTLWSYDDDHHVLITKWQWIWWYRGGGWWLTSSMSPRCPPRLLLRYCEGWKIGMWAEGWMRRISCLVRGVWGGGRHVLVGGEGHVSHMGGWAGRLRRVSRVGRGIWGLVAGWVGGGWGCQGGLGQVDLLVVRAAKLTSSAI